MFTAAASAAVPKLSRRDANTRGSVIERHTPSNPNSQGRSTRAANGTSTISDSHSRVTPKAGAKPGSAERRAASIISPV